MVCPAAPLISTRSSLKSVFPQVAGCQFVAGNGGGGMTTGPVRASSEWLRLRERADAGARASDLAERVQSYLPMHGGATIHDLGCGTGSMARWLAGRLRGPQHWVMYDRDDDLTRVTMETRRRDITRMEQVELAGGALITASALLDMMTTEELERFVATCAGVGCPVLIALSVTGRVEITPAEPFDQSVTGAFNAHQRRTTSTGTLLGPDAVGATVDSFTRSGREVLVRPSPWRLGPGHAALAAAWFTGWLAAACEQRPELRAHAPSYAKRRLAEASAGHLSVTVHHQDLLVLSR
jgi:hypothetical protein